jgi:hypothetical protein
MLKYYIVIISLINMLFMSVNAFAAEKKLLLELYTSQGCKSCIIADQLLGKINQGENYISLEFHVDYWDKMGWNDPFAKDIFAKRQQQYIDNLNSPAVYTPQLIINGKTEAIASYKKDVVNKIRLEQSKMDEIGVTVKVEFVDFPTCVVSIENTNNIKGEYDVIFASYQKTLLTEISEGVNAGKILKNNNVVTDIMAVEKWYGGGKEISFDFPQDMAADGFVVFLQEAGQGRIIAADNYHF